MANEKETKPVQYQNLCPECQTGVMCRKQLTYFTWLNEELITVPNFPAWVCDVCGKREYDNRAIIRLNAMLSHGGGRRLTRNRNRRSGATSADFPRT